MAKAPWFSGPTTTTRMILNLGPALVVLFVLLWLFVTIVQQDRQAIPELRQDHAKIKDSMSTLIHLSWAQCINQAEDREERERCIPTETLSFTLPETVASNVGRQTAIFRPTEEMAQSSSRSEHSSRPSSARTLSSARSSVSVAIQKSTSSTASSTAASSSAISSVAIASSAASSTPSLQIHIPIPPIPTVSDLLGL